MTNEDIKINGTIDKEHKLPCKNCDNQTYHKVLSSVNRHQSAEDTNLIYDFEIVVCLGCREISFRSNWVFSEDVYFEPETGQLVPVNHQDIFPNRIAGRKELKDADLLPPSIQNIYRETYIAFSNRAPLLTGVGIRALVEAICKDKKANGKDLEKRIDALVTLKILTEEGAKILHGTRLMGNKAIHELNAPSDSMLEAAMNLTEHLMTGLYILNKKAKALPKRRLPKATIPKS